MDSQDIRVDLPAIPACLQNITEDNIYMESPNIQSKYSKGRHKSEDQMDARLTRLMKDMATLRRMDGFLFRKLQSLQANIEEFRSNLPLDGDWTLDSILDEDEYYDEESLLRTPYKKMDNNNENVVYANLPPPLTERHEYMELEKARNEGIYMNLPGKDTSSADKDTDFYLDQKTSSLSKHKTKKVTH